MALRVRKPMELPLEVKRLHTSYNFFPSLSLPHPTHYISELRAVDELFMLGWVRNVYKVDGRVMYFDRYVTAVGDHVTRHGGVHPDFQRHPVNVSTLEYGDLRPFEILDIMEGPELVKGLPGKLDYFDNLYVQSLLEACYDQRRRDLWGWTKTEEQIKLEEDNRRAAREEKRWSWLYKQVDAAWEDEFRTFGTPMSTDTYEPKAKGEMHPAGFRVIDRRRKHATRRYTTIESGRTKRTRKTEMTGPSGQPD
jgi:hypothetical protein